MIRTRSLRMSGVALAGCIALAGCNRQPEATIEQEDARPGTRSDAAISTDLQSRFYDDDVVRGAYIDVSTDNGVVTLQGRAQSDLAKGRALEIARSSEGVTRVEDRLVVAPSPPLAAEARQANADQPAATTGEIPVNPAWITTKIQAQYFTDADVKPWNVDVTTLAGGVVELRGEVEDAEAKAEAVRIARATDGVTRVDDHLRIEGDTATVEQSGTADPWVTTKIQAKYFVDEDVRALDIDVDTNDGVVTLRGTVPSELAHRQAVALARNTDGVRDIRDQLQVQPGAASDAAPTASRVAGGVDDAWITTKIQSQYFLDSDVKGREIDVDTNNGVVTLSGSVATDASKRKAEQIARETEGVSRVVNRLTMAQP